MLAQFSSTSSRLTAPVPSTRPSALARPRLVVASASKPSAARSFAVPASQGFGMMNAPSRSCSARNACAFLSWVVIGPPWPILATMDEALILARIQFGLNIAFHILFPSITIGLAWLLVVFRVRYERTRDPAWLV